MEPLSLGNSVTSQRADWLLEERERASKCLLKFRCSHPPVPISSLSLFDSSTLGRDRRRPHRRRHPRRVTDAFHRTLKGVLVFR
ncbi:hypothetical protein VNO80_09784 [Phaseolus coccineus]|uniref:Uncharacterized protein n=1 Tax=Phaseolus coccineus TaxID=3886 RepID=A0AAN9N8P0_PHACN